MRKLSADDKNQITAFLVGILVGVIIALLAVLIYYWPFFIGPNAVGLYV